MSANIGDQTLLAHGVVTTPTGATTILFRMGANGTTGFGWLVTGMNVVIRTAGAQALSELRLRTSAPVTLASYVMGTAVADTITTTLPSAANAFIAAGTIVELVHITIDASIVYDYQLYGTLIHN